MTALMAGSTVALILIMIIIVNIPHLSRINEVKHKAPATSITFEYNVTADTSKAQLKDTAMQ